MKDEIDKILFEELEQDYDDTIRNRIVSVVKEHIQNIPERLEGKWLEGFAIFCYNEALKDIKKSVLESLGDDKVVE